ncbi:hypothetical protein NDU88_005507 [Pleurodeles waltl]|uniref:Uncharacterized protein n=1 Tax=Pleurodeles waltl TaxID=8319 RepID=A0AAV7X0U9_PLEWA|nr:hypothetical protein NDU88_005507 [Pleurodeles waltl]
MRPVLLMHVKDVDLQPVPRLEGPVAEGAQEFPVPQVDAVRVLEVLVPVVLVGAHLPAPLAGEAPSGL